MKIFKGKMSLWNQLTDGKAMKAPGGLADTSTYKSALINIIVGFLAYFIFWNADAVFNNFGGWLKDPMSWFFPTTSWNLLEPSVRRHHFYACFFLFISLILSLWNGIDIFLTRRRARKSAEGQWYDKPGLTKEDLYGPSHDRHADKQ